jgi:1-phosphatidylinositol-3-phosphate 5-kinase
MDHTQYFAYKNLVAIFEYKSLEVREILLPPPNIPVHVKGQELEELREEMKRVTMKGLEVSSAVHEKLVSLKDELSQTSLSSLSNEYTLLEEKERNDIRRKAGDVQGFLCEDQLDTVRKIAIQDSLLLMNRMIASYTQSWTQRIDDLLVKRREERNNQTKSMSSVSSSASINIARQSSSSVNDSVFNAGETSFSRSTSSSRLEDSGEQNQKTLTQKDFLVACQEASTRRSSYDETEEVGGDSNISVLGASPSTSSLSSINYGTVSVEEPQPVFTAQFAIGGEVLEKEEEVVDLKKLEPPKSTSASSRRSDISVKSSLKTIINSVLSVTTASFEIESPFPSYEHYLLNQTESLPVLVKDDDPGSIIAFTLASAEYEEELRIQQNIGDSSPNKIVVQSPKVPEVEEPNVPASSEDVIEPSLSFASGSAMFVKTQAFADSVPSVSEISQVEIKFSDYTAKFTCRCYFPEHFKRLRDQVVRASLVPESSVFESEEAFIRSLANCIPWKAKGGKSKSAFRKTCDDRFVVKEMTKTELQSFCTTATAYFEYMEANLKAKDSQTVLAKILGVYKVTHNSLTGSTSKAMYLLVMENLFYQRNITQKFDLKGSARNRLADTNTVDEVVLLDENLMRMLRESPLYVRPSDKRMLQNAIKNDTQFLTKYELLDYSLLVGLDEVNQVLVVGIIDYVRSYTWDKRLEMIVKTGLPGKEKPTIVKPESYRERFIDKMDHYFLAVPDPSYQLEQESKM